MSRTVSDPTKATIAERIREREWKPSTVLADCVLLVSFVASLCFLYLGFFVESRLIFVWLDGVYGFLLLLLSVVLLINRWIAG